MVGARGFEGDGIIYVTNNSNNSLLWFAFFENNEEFKMANVDEFGEITAITSGGVKCKMNIHNPLNFNFVRKD